MSSNHRILEVEFWGLRSWLAVPARFSWGEARARNLGLVQVVTDEGLVGWGETSVTVPLWSLEERALTVRQGLRPLVVGQGLDDPDSVLSHVRSRLGRLAALWSPVAIQASIGAFEMALWDLRGKICGQPLYRLLGGREAPDSVPLYASGFSGTPEQIAQQTSVALSQGFEAVKLRIGMAPELDLVLVETVRRAIGDGQLLADANMAWERDQAFQMARRLDDFCLRWLEEPLDCRDVEGLAWLRARVAVPMAAGENAYNLDEGRRLVDLEAVDIIMPDLSRCGGLTVARAMVSQARARGLLYSPHHYGSDLGFAACLHFCASEPGLTYLMRDVSDWPLGHQVCASGELVRNGKGIVPEGPGLGVEVDMDALQCHRVI